MTEAERLARREQIKAQLAAEWRLKAEQGIDHDHLSDLAFLLVELEYAEAALKRSCQTPMNKQQSELERIAADPAFRVKGWDSYDAAPLDDRAVAAAQRFFGYLWAVVPTNSGGIQLERHDNGCDIEVEFNADGSLESVFATVA